MNEKIINNLFELWSEVGQLNGVLNRTEQYSAVSMQGSDWPSRVFNLREDELGEIISLSQGGELPGLITLGKTKALVDKPELEFVFGQKNMALEMDQLNEEFPEFSNIIPIRSKKEAIIFAETASKSFGYKVDPSVIYNLVKGSGKASLFIYQEDAQALGCGMLFLDSKNIAGLHMIGTLPEGRGKGIGKSMTQGLLKEAQTKNAKYVVLHASLMGEGIYKRLGFETYGVLETYRVLKP